MKHLFLFFFTLSALSTPVLAIEDQSLDELMSPNEIWQELLEGEQEQEIGDDLDLTTLFEPLGFFDFLRPRRPEPPQKEWNALLPEESSQLYGTDWLTAYEIVIVINKAAHGPTAQTATVYWQGQKFDTFYVSTGRETSETSKSGRKYFSNTATGWFHPTWLSRDHVSKTWEAPMPFAVFFNGGIATHAALPAYYNKLGSRASGGCVRFHPTQAEWIFNHIQKAGKGLVPEFSKTGEPILDANGNQKLSENWRSLIIVVNREN